MKHVLLASMLLVALKAIAQQPLQLDPMTPNPAPTSSAQESCLLCKQCTNSPVDQQASGTCLLCRACSAVSQGTSQASNQTTVRNETYQTLTTAAAAPAAKSSPAPMPAPFKLPSQPTSGITPATVGPTQDNPAEWRTHAGAFDLHLETGGVFNGPSIAACDLNAFTCGETGKTHVAGDFGATYWINPALGLTLSTVLMDGGSIAGISENSVGAYLGLQLQRPRGAVRPYLEIAPGYVHSFTTGNSGAVQFNPDLASVKAGGGVRFLVGRRWGVKLGVNALPSFNGLGHQTPVTVTAGWFWQSKGRGSTD